MAAERNVVNTLDPVRPSTTELNTVCSDVRSDVRSDQPYSIHIHPHYDNILCVEVN